MFTPMNPATLPTLSRTQYQFSSRIPSGSISSRWAKRSSSRWYSSMCPRVARRRFKATAVASFRARGRIALRSSAMSAVADVKLSSSATGATA